MSIEIKPILLVEDSPRDTELAINALTQNKLANEVVKRTVTQCRRQNQNCQAHQQRNSTTAASPPSIAPFAPFAGKSPLPTDYWLPGAVRRGRARSPLRAALPFDILRFPHPCPLFTGY